MEILGNLGHIKRALYASTGLAEYQISYDPMQIHQILDSTDRMIEKIQIKTRENTICPINILEASTNVAQNNPGTLSDAVKKTQRIFSRIFENGTKTTEEK